MANLRLAEVVDSLQAMEELQLVTLYLKDAIDSFTQALKLRPGDIGSEWGTGVKERILDCFEAGFRRAGTCIIWLKYFSNYNLDYY